MKKMIAGFICRGLWACGFGPLILAIVYSILEKQGIVDTLSVDEVCTGIVSLFALAFVAGGMNVIYQIERIPLMAAIFIHGCVLYLSYLFTYLLNDWLDRGVIPVLVFSGIFIVGYLVIWAVIYSVIKRKTKRLNAMLEKRQMTT